MLGLELVRAIARVRIFYARLAFLVVVATVLVLIITVILASLWELRGGSCWAIR